MSNRTERDCTDPVWDDILKRMRKAGLVQSACILEEYLNEQKERQEASET